MTNSFKVMIIAPTSMPLLFPAPPMTKAAQTRNVVLEGCMNEGCREPRYHANNAPANAAIAAETASAEALWVMTSCPWCCATSSSSLIDRRILPQGEEYNIESVRQTIPTQIRPMIARRR